MGLTSSPQGLVTQSLKASGTAVLEALNEQPLSVDREERYRLSEVTHIDTPYRWMVRLCRSAKSRKSFLRLLMMGG